MIKGLISTFIYLYFQCFDSYPVLVVESYVYVGVSGEGEKKSFGAWGELQHIARNSYTRNYRPYYK